MIHFPEKEEYLADARIGVFIDIANQISDKTSKWTTRCRHDFPLASDVNRFTRRAYHCKSHQWQSFLNKLSEQHVRLKVDQVNKYAIIKPFNSTDSMPGGEYVYIKFGYGNFAFKDIQYWDKRKASKANADGSEADYIYMLSGMTFISNNISWMVEALKIAPDSPEIKHFLNVITTLLNRAQEDISASLHNCEKLYHTAERDIHEINSLLNKTMEEMEWQAPANIRWCHWNDLDYEVEIESDPLTTCKYESNKEGIIIQAKPLITFAKGYALLHQRYKHIGLISKGW